MTRQQLLVITGKGGVGKSTLAATLGRILVSRGSRVLLLEIDPRESLHELLDVPPSSGEVVQVEPALHLQNLRPRTVLDRLVREHLRLGFLVGRVLSSPVYQHFAEGAPGLKEMAVLGHALRVVRGLAGDGFPEVDQVVIDAPATGHGVSMLSSPRLVSEVIRDGPVGRMGREIAELVSDPERCGIVVATLAEEMPVQEAIELSRALEERLSQRPELIVVNGLYPPLDGDGPGRGDPTGDALGLWRRRRRVNDRELRRLAEAWKGPRIDLPLIALPRGPELVSALAVPLDQGLSVSEGGR
jgi:anion-transporting  ArsA/GET3 family ATPase